MRFVFITILVIFFLGLVIKDSNEVSKGMSFWDFIINFTHISSLNRGADEKTEEFENEEYLLNQQIAQLDHAFESKLQNQSRKDAEETARLIQQNQRNFKEQQEVMRNLMESNQMRAEAQMDRLNELMEQHQMYMEALIDRMNTLMEQRQNSLRNSARPY